MTEELPWGSRGSSSETASVHAEGGGRAVRQATMVGDRDPEWPAAGAWDDGEWMLTEPMAPNAGEIARDASAAPIRWSPQQAASGEPASVSTSRRHLLEARPASPEPSGPEDDVFGPRPQDARRAADSPFPVDVRHAGTVYGHPVRRFVERWSRWVAGLGLPPRDPRGGRRYVERLFPPAVWLIAALGVAVFVGLLTGILVSSPGAGPGSVHTAVATATVTVTNAQTTTATATVTRTRTRTRTVTAPAPVQNTGQNAAPTAAPNGQNGQNGGQVLAPGSQGPQVFLLQQALARLGLFAGPPTGVYDAQTAAAVQNFQARAGITADPPGVAGPTTLQALRGALGQ